MYLTYSLKKVEKEGKEYTFKNYQLHIELDNGQTILLNIKPAFDIDKHMLNNICKRALTNADLKKQEK